MDFSQLLSRLGPPGYDRGESRQQRLYALLKAAIVDGSLPAGVRLPASRSLAAEWGMARNTVLFAYEQLLAEGFLLADRRGTRVADLGLAAPLPRPFSPPAGRGESGGHTLAGGERPPAARPGFSARSHGLPARSGHSGILPFLPGVPDLNAFPWPVWARYLQKAWGEVSARQLAYAPPGGEPLLRAAIATHLRARRGVVCSPEQVLITSGAQAALDACARLLADVGELAWLENPGYPAAAGVMRAAGLNVAHIPVDGEGMAPAPRDWQERPPRLVYVTPSHQYPLGAVLGLERRLELLRRARAAGAWIIEDDYDSEFRYAPGAPGALQGLAPQAPVVYVGTFSKILYPGLRIGYMVLPPWAAAEMAAGVEALFRPGQAVEQRALARFLESGRLTAHLRCMRRRYAARQELLRQELKAAFGGRIAILGGAAGLHLTVLFPEGPADEAIVMRAAELGVGARALSTYYACEAHGAALNGLVLGYGMAEEAVIPELVARLARAVAAA